MTRRRIILPEKIVCELDPKIRPIIEALNQEGFETIESCQGGPGHPWDRGFIMMHLDSIFSEDVPIIEQIIKEHTQTPFRIGRFNIPGTLGFANGIEFRGPVR